MNLRNICLPGPAFPKPASCLNRHRRDWTPGQLICSPDRDCWETCAGNADVFKYKTFFQFHFSPRLGPARSLSSSPSQSLWAPCPPHVAQHWGGIWALAHTMVIYLGESGTFISQSCGWGVAVRWVNPCKLWGSWSKLWAVSSRPFSTFWLEKSFKVIESSFLAVTP